MKRLLFMAFCLTTLSTIKAQKDHVVNVDDKTIEVSKPGLRTSEGLKGSEYKYNFKGVNSTTVLKKGKKLEFLITKGDGLINPETDVRIVKFKVEKKKRTTRTFIAGPLNKEGNESPKLVSGGEVQKLDVNTIKVSVSNLEVGEYAIVLGDVDFVKNKTKMGTSIGFYCFSIIE